MDIDLIPPKKQIFRVENYSFLHKKRQNSKKKAKHFWTADENAKLSNLILQSPYHNLSWLETASFFDCRNRNQCRLHWNFVLNPNIKKGKWSKEEDKILIELISKEGLNWSKIAQTLQGRSSKQIRNRWINQLSLNSKSFIWTEELDRVLLANYLKYGSSWTLISKFIDNSTENMVKNRFYSLLRKFSIKHSKRKVKRKLQNQDPDTEIINEHDKRKQLEKFLALDFDQDNRNKNDEIKERRNNFSLDYLLNYLPDLLKEKGITIIQPQVHSFILNETQKQILANFCNLLAVKLYQVVFNSLIIQAIQVVIFKKLMEKLKISTCQYIFNCLKQTDFYDLFN